jgi:hypothetical protein
VSISPRWAASQSSKADITLHYPASDGYCSYRYNLDRKKRRITIDVTGSFEQAQVHCLLPGRGGAKKVLVNGEPVKHRTRRIERSTYADFDLDYLPAGPVVVQY